MENRTSSRRDSARWTIALVGVVVALVVVIGVGPPGVLLQHVTVCKLGAEVGTYVIWTPLSIINKPYLTNISEASYSDTWNYTITSGSLSMGTLPATGSGGYGGEGTDGPQGGVDLTYQNHNWTFFHTTNETIVGTTPGPCTQPYVAELGAGQGCGAWLTVPLFPDNSSDTNEPHVWNGTAGANGNSPGCTVETPGTYVWFDSSFRSGGTGNYAPVNWNLCHQGGSYPLQLLGEARIPVVVTVPYQGRDISVSGFLNWYGDPTGQTFGNLGNATEITTYYLVPGGWNWTLAPVGPAAFPIDPDSPLPSLVAFERSAC